MTTGRVAAVLAILAVPALCAPLLARARSRMPRRLWCSCAGLIAVAPLAVPWVVARRASPLSVWLVAIAGAITMVKAIDWLSRPRQEQDLIRVWLVLTVWPALAIEDVGVPIAKMRDRMRLVLTRLGVGSVAGVCGLTLTALGQGYGAAERGFLIDSSLKAIEIGLLAGAANHVLVAAFALAGYRIKDGFRYPFFAHSVLDFWSRYNVWIHGWLKRNIFEPIARRRRKPVMGVLAVFTFSGLAHEYLFMPVSLELLGWQLAFFLAHGLGAISGVGLGWGFERVVGRRVPRALAVATTLAFVLLTAPLFLHSLDRVVDLHRGLGAWVLATIGR